jgi:hypothetical protein
MVYAKKGLQNFAPVFKFEYLFLTNETKPLGIDGKVNNHATFGIVSSYKSRKNRAVQKNEPMEIRQWKFKVIVMKCFKLKPFIIF